MPVCPCLYWWLDAMCVCVCVCSVHGNLFTFKISIENAIISSNKKKKKIKFESNICVESMRKVREKENPKKMQQFKANPVQMKK